MVGGRIAAALWDVASRTCSILLVAFLCVVAVKVFLQGIVTTLKHSFKLYYYKNKYKSYYCKVYIRLTEIWAFNEIFIFQTKTLSYNDLSIDLSILAWWLECSPMARETWVQKIILDASLLNTQHYKIVLRVQWSNPGKGEAPSPTPWCSSYRKGSLWVTLEYGRRIYLLYIYIYMYIYKDYIHISVHRYIDK